MEKIFIPSDTGVQLEAVWYETDLAHALIICHPHPRYGGSMQNNVVQALLQEARTQEFSALIFNFRGVGESGGFHSEHGDGELADLHAVYRFMRETYSNKQLHLAGYSYGAWISLRFCQQANNFISLALIAPPLDAIPFDGLDLPIIPTAIIYGELDHYASFASVNGWLEQASNGTALVHKTFKGVDHFWIASEHRLCQQWTEFVKNSI